MLGSMVPRFQTLSAQSGELKDSHPALVALLGASSKHSRNEKKRKQGGRFYKGIAVPVEDCIVQSLIKFPSHIS